MAIPVTAVTAVAAVGSKMPLRRAARRFPGLRLRCSDKAVLPSVKLLGRGAHERDRCACGQRVVQSSCQYRPRKLTRPMRHGGSPLNHRRYLARGWGGVCNHFR